MGATLSMLGMYNYDNTIFDNMVVPDTIDFEVLRDNLLMEISDFSVIYTDFQFLKFAIGAWSKKELPIWNKLLETTKYEYNPIHNYDRTEEVVDNEIRNLSKSNTQTRDLRASNNEIRNLSGSNNETRNLTGSINETRNLTYDETDILDAKNKTSHESETSGTTTNNGKDITNEYNVAFNSTTPTLAKKVETELGSGNENSGTVKYTTEVEEHSLRDKSNTEKGTVTNATADSGTINTSRSDNGTINNSMTDNGTITNNDTDTGTITNTHTVRAHGNIGVTTTQQMIEAEREVVKFNLMDYIINSFKCKFCILLY